MASRVSVVVLVALAAACGAPAGRGARSAEARSEPPPKRIVIERRAPSGSAYRYTFEREASPVATTLRGVFVLAKASITMAVAVGDDGVVLERRSDGSWNRMPTTTRERLNAWCGRNTVGAHGTITGDDGMEPSHTSHDLAACYGHFAVGSAGTILERLPDSGWRSVQSPTTADLRALWETLPRCEPGTPAPLYAFGRGGAIVRCAHAGCHPDGQPVTCQNVASPTDADLNAFGYYFRLEENGRGYRSVVPFAVGAHGTLIRSDGTGERWLSAPTGIAADLRAATVNPYFGGDAKGAAVTPEPIVVGDRCTAAFVGGLEDGGAVTTDAIPLDCTSDLLGVSAFGLHVLMVGAGGTIWHGTVDGITMPETTIEPL
jgi:hypothetical protein